MAQYIKAIKKFIFSTVLQQAVVCPASKLFPVLPAVTNVVKHEFPFLISCHKNVQQAVSFQAVAICFGCVVYFLSYELSLPFLPAANTVVHSAATCFFPSRVITHEQ